MFIAARETGGARGQGDCAPLMNVGLGNEALTEALEDYVIFVDQLGPQAFEVFLRIGELSDEAGNIITSEEEARAILRRNGRVKFRNKS